jgi:hypothetical protein
MTEEQKTRAKASNTKRKKTAAKKPVAKETAVKDSSTRKPKTPKNAKTAAVAKLKSKTSVIQTQVPRMKQVYIEEVSQVLVREFGYENPMEVPNCSQVPPPDQC